MDVVPVPAPGAIAAYEYPFHVGYDVAVLAPKGSTVFFRDFAEFADGIPKRRPEECNLSGQGNCFPAGTAKRLVGVSIQVVDAADDDLFELDLVCGCQCQRTLTIRSGMKEAVYLDPPFLIVGQEHFEIHVRAPDRLREKRAYARVTLHGPYMVSFAE